MIKNRGFVNKKISFFKKLKSYKEGFHKIIYYIYKQRRQSGLKRAVAQRGGDLCTYIL